MSFTIRQFLPSLFLLLFLVGCAIGENHGYAEMSSWDESDLACAYSYFLKGSHAEYNQRFEEALQHFQKALICDPSAKYIQEKLPVLLIRSGNTEEASTLLAQAIKESPDKISNYMLLAHLQIQQDKRDEAIKLYRQVLEKDPENESVLMRLGILQMQQEQYVEAERIFQGLINKNPELYYAHIYLGRLYQQKGEFTKSTESYHKALSLNWSADLAFELIDFYHEQELYEEMLDLYSEILKVEPYNQTALLGRVQTLLNLGRDEQALDELQQLRDQSENQQQLDLAISKIMLRIGKLDDAVTLLNTITNGETGPEANYLLGLIAYQRKEIDRSISHLQRIKPNSEEYVDAIYLQVQILREQGETDKAIGLLTSNTTNKDLHHPLFFILLSSLLQEDMSDDKALKVITAGIDYFPKNEQLHFEHALLLERIGATDKALETMQLVLEISPDHPEALNYVGYTWADKNINLEQAYIYIRRAVELKPNNGFIQDSLGWVYFRLGNLKQALLVLLEAIRLEPEDPHIHVHLGDVYRALNRLEEARNAYLKGLEMFRDESQKSNVRQKLDELDLR